MDRRDDLTRRAFAVDQAFLVLGHETFEAEGARFVRAPEYPTVHDANHIHAVRAATPDAVVRLLERADREFAHCRHRLVRLDADTPPVVEAMLVVRGYRREATVVLLLEGDLSGDAPAHEIRPIEDEAGWQAHARLKQADWDEVAASKGLRDVAHVGAQMARIDRAKSPPVTWWLAYVDGTPCGYVASFAGCEGVGQVEDLYVDPAMRRRGVATALIRRAVADCRARGAGPVLIVADVDDTPKQMYVALGFRPLGVAQKYTLHLPR
jgi:GNAT superfamily N-acetyltransferase